MDVDQQSGGATRLGAAPGGKTGTRNRVALGPAVIGLLVDAQREHTADHRDDVVEAGIVGTLLGLWVPVARHQGRVDQGVEVFAVAAHKLVPGGVALVEVQHLLVGI